MTANIANRTGIIVLISSFRRFNISIKDIGTIKGQKTVVIKHITKVKNLSSGEEVGWRRENLTQLLKK
ncbi:hypothetical protein [Anabaena subtropica]|uniref:Uncharacterized protein n=1 Tax=Anabaena subtropica FACHB-260 TaxID=2692884 RepID=A0ABR8CJC4_9NOST|nr:hypothetical protein [Anabaena subtropica]MBD2342923.1 hypothetical protein [Anabaena subtropica FACHB-260]